MFKILCALGVLSLLLQSGQATATAMSCFKLTDGAALKVDGVKLSPRLVQKVRALESQLGKEAVEVVKISKDLKDVRASLLEIKSTMNKRERLLWGWLAKLLGGDPVKIQEYKTRAERLSEVKSLLKKEKKDKKSANQNVISSINDYLKNTDDKFRQLRRTQEDIYTAACKGNECLASIETALRKVRVAERSVRRKMQEEAFGESSHDEFNRWQDDFENFGVSGPNRDTRVAVRTTKEAFDQAEDFDRALSRVQDSVSKSRSIQSRKSNQTMDLVFDLYLNFDFNVGLGSLFGGIFKSYELRNMKSNLEGLQNGVSRITEDMTREHQELKTNLDHQICVVRDMCR